MSANVFRHFHRVTYNECTVGNHVYYGRFLDYCEEARGEFFRSLGRSFLEWQEKEIIFPVIEVRVRYKAGARYDDVLSIETFVTQAEGIRLTFGYRLLNQDQRLLVEAATAHVCASLAEKPRRLPPDLCTWLQPYLRGSEQSTSGMVS